MAIEKRRMQQRYGTYEQFQSDLQNILDHEFISVDSGDTTLEGTTKGLYFKFPGGDPVRIYTTNEMENYNNKFNYYSVASGGDLDIIKDTGFYNFAGVDGYSNIPGGQTSKIKGTLLVVNHKFTTSTDVWNIDQYWFSPTKEVFARTYNYNEQFSSGSWSSWILIATNINNIVEDITDLQNRTTTLESKSTAFNTRITDMEAGKENVSNKINTIDFPSATYYPSSLAVWDYVTSKISTPLADIETLKSGKLDKTDFNSYKTSNDNAVNNKVNTTDFNAYKSATDTDISKCVTDIANNSALISKNQINVTTDKSTSIVLNDSSDCNIVDLICDSDNYNLSIYGKNLFNLKNTRIWINDYVVPASLIVDNNSINFDITPGNFCGIYIRYNVIVKDNLLLDKSCVISLNVTADKDCKFRLRDESKNIVEVKNLTSNVATQFNLPIMLNNSGKAISMYGIDIGENTHIKISNIMIELGAVATEYEDYKDMQSVTQDTDLSTVHTYYPSTTVISDSDFILNYIADTKNYIDSKFNELATAIVAHESEVS